jgi:hypothetical protein
MDAWALAGITVRLVPVAVAMPDSTRVPEQRIRVPARPGGH